MSSPIKKSVTERVTHKCLSFCCKCLFYSLKIFVQCALIFAPYLSMMPYFLSCLVSSTNFDRNWVWCKVLKMLTYRTWNRTQLQPLFSNCPLCYFCYNIHPSATYLSFTICAQIFIRPSYSPCLHSFEREFLFAVSVAYSHWKHFIEFFSQRVPTL